MIYAVGTRGPSVRTIFGRFLTNFIPTVSSMRHTRSEVRDSPYLERSAIFDRSERDWKLRPRAWYEPWAGYGLNTTTPRSRPLEFQNDQRLSLRPTN